MSGAVTGGDTSYRRSSGAVTGYFIPEIVGAATGGPVETVEATTGWIHFIPEMVLLE